VIGAVDVGFAFRAPQWFALAAVVLAVVLVRRRRRAHVATSGGFVFADGALPRSLRQRLAGLPLLLELSALLLLVTALARPVVLEAEPPRRLGRDVLLCFDRSSSMAEQDLAPGRSRLQVGKQLAAEFLLARPDDRLGLVAFARFADLVCPPTVDHEAAAGLLRDVALVDSEGPEDATAIGAAVGMAAELLQRAQSTGKLIVLLTDGEENVAVAGAPEQIAPVHAGQWCRELGIRVHVIVLGKAAALDTTAVQQLAALTTGRFFTAADERALRAVYAEIDRLEGTRFAEPGVHVVEWFALPLLLALLLLTAAHGLRRSPLGALP